MYHDHLDSPPKKFPHRVNSDGTIDSICPDCFVTVASAENDDSLMKFERMHVCRKEDLARYQAWKQKQSA